MIQCSRIAFGFGGIFDQDEAERIVEKEINPIPARRQTGKDAAEAAKQASDAVIDEGARESLVARLRTVAHTQGLDAYAEAFKALSRDDRRVLGQEAHESLKALAVESDKAAADGVDTQNGEVDSDE